MLVAGCLDVDTTILSVRIASRISSVVGYWIRQYCQNAVTVSGPHHRCKETGKERRRVETAIDVPSRKWESIKYLGDTKRRRMRV